MPAYQKSRSGRIRRRMRVRKRVIGKAERPRLSVFRSARHIYAQIIDDASGSTLIAASTLDKEFAKELEAIEKQVAEELEKAAQVKDKKKGKNVALPDARNKIKQARAVGRLIAKKAIAKEQKTVVFDRNGFVYHGRVKALAEGAREGGLIF